MSTRSRRLHRVRAKDFRLPRQITWSPPGMNLEVRRFLAYHGLISIGLLGISDVVFNFYLVSLGYTLEDIGLVQALPRVGGFLTSMPVGLLANRIGTQRVMLVSTIGSSVTYVMLAVWPSLFGLGLSRFGLGLFYGAIQIATTPLLIHLSVPEHETRAFTYLNAVSMGTTAIGSVIGGFLPLLAVRIRLATSGQTASAYRFALVITALLIAWSALLLLRLPNPRSDRAAPSSGSRQFSIPWRRLIVLSSPLLLFGFTGGLTFPFYNLFFRTTYAASDQAVGTILSVGWVGMATIPLAGPWIEQRWGRAWSIGVAMTISSAAFLGLSGADVLTAGVACYVVAIAFRNIMQPLFQPLIMSTLPRDLHNITSGIGMVLWNLGWFAATAISGTWQADYGFGVIMRVVAVGVFLHGAMVVWLFRRNTHVQMQTPQP